MLVVWESRNLRVMRYIIPASDKFPTFILPVILIFRLYNLFFQNDIFRDVKLCSIPEK